MTGCYAEGYLFRRLYDNGTPNDYLDDYGPFVQADVYAQISGGLNVPETFGLTAIDPDRPNLTGRDYIQKPLMVLAGEFDSLKDANGDLTQDPDLARYYDPVVSAFGINDYPAYGVVIDGANHMTAVNCYAGISSWNFGTIYTLLMSKLNFFRNLGSDKDEDVSGDEHPLYF